MDTTHSMGFPPRARILAVFALVFLGGCDIGSPLSGPFGNEVSVCVDGDAGRCCVVESTVSRVGCIDDDGACRPDLLTGPPVVGCAGRQTCTAPYRRTPSRCIYCQAWELADGGVDSSGDSSPPSGPPPQPPPDAGSTYVRTCGPASYE